MVEFLFTLPAIAFALGSYGYFLASAVPILDMVLGCCVLFILVNLLYIKGSAIFSLMVIRLAVFGLLLRLGLVAPHFRPVNFLVYPVSLRAALPFAAALPGY